MLYESSCCVFCSSSILISPINVYHVTAGRKLCEKVGTPTKCLLSEIGLLVCVVTICLGLRDDEECVVYRLLNCILTPSDGYEV